MSTGAIFCSTSTQGGVVDFRYKAVMILMILVVEDRYRLLLSIDTKTVPVALDLNRIVTDCCWKLADFHFFVKNPKNVQI